MSAQPIHEEDPCDPQVILRDLPEREHAVFLQRYREALDEAKDPAGYKRLQRMLHMWSISARALSKALRENPSYYEDLAAETEGIRNGTIQTIPIEDVFPDWPEYVAAARANRHA